MLGPFTPSPSQLNVPKGHVCFPASTDVGLGHMFVLTVEMGLDVAYAVGRCGEALPLVTGHTSVRGCTWSGPTEAQTLSHLLPVLVSPGPPRVG